MASPQTDGGNEITAPVGAPTALDYLRPVWRFKLLVVLVVALAAAATYVVVNRGAKVYQASTELNVGQSALQQALNPTTGAATANTLANDASLVTTPAVANVVRANLELPYTSSALLGRIRVIPSATGDILTITATAADPNLAARLANGFAAAYFQLSRRTIVRNAQSALKTALARLRHHARGAANVAVVQALQGQIGTLEGIIVSPPPAGQQVAPAAVPGTPVSPKPTRSAIFAGALALLLGIILSYVFDRRDRRVRSVEEVETLYGVPVLATVPRVRRIDASPEDPCEIPIALREPHRTLRVNVEVSREQRDAKVLMVTSALPSEGKSTVVRNLALSYREAGARVAVVEADLRRPVLAGRFGVDHGPGLTEALVGGGPPRMQRVPREGAAHNGRGGSLDVLVAGTVPEDPTVLLAGKDLRRLILELEAAYDVVFIDSPPALLVSDALPLLSLADGVIIVARAGAVTYPAAARLRRTIDRMSGINRVYVLGVVVNDVVDELAGYERRGGRDSRTHPAVPAPEHAS